MVGSIPHNSRNPSSKLRDKRYFLLGAHTICKLNQLSSFILFTSVNSSPETANAGFTTTRLLSDQAAPRNIHRIDRPLLFQTIDFIPDTVTMRDQTFTVRQPQEPIPLPVRTIGPQKIL
jgi:hypothetical protein